MISNHNIINKIVIILIIILISSCTTDERSSESTVTKTDSINLKVYKSRSCQCCKKWIKHLKENEIVAKPYDTNKLSLFKNQYGVPKNYRSCHTAISSEGYVFEGHIPANIIKIFLNDKPENSIGLVVPGMPVGSPGMEYENKFAPYKVLSISQDGSVSTYATINTKEEQYK